eukprot:GILJ01005743.1.p1 GENE.GILJ01005743.1~~GILJ01005743.1.p1  ORF type:complete len:749 (-),score=118.36 GILJ01005743.1:66-2312(-)
MEQQQSRSSTPLLPPFQRSQTSPFNNGSQNIPAFSPVNYSGRSETPPMQPPIRRAPTGTLPDFAAKEAADPSRSPTPPMVPPTRSFTVPIGETKVTPPSSVAVSPRSTANDAVNEERVLVPLQLDFLEGADFVDEAVPLIEVVDQQFAVATAAKHILSKVSDNIAVIAIAGLYRTGKSYLINRLLGLQKGFSVAPTVNACTKGIWFWGRPLQRTLPSGEKLTILLMDTEGLGAIDQDQNHDSRIFSLATLLSSFMIYNSLGSIDENAINNLSFVVNLTKHIHIQATTTQEDDGTEFSRFFPSFLWVVRDFALELVDTTGRPISSKDYLENALKPQGGFSAQTGSRNRIRTLLTSFFKDRDCVTVVRPLNEESELQQLDSLPTDKLRKEFNDEMEYLRNKVLSTCKPKKLKGKTLDGKSLLTLCHCYVDAINTGAVPTIAVAWDTIVDGECQAAAQAALNQYKSEMEKVVHPADEDGDLGPIEDEEFKAAHRRLKKAAVKSFDAHAIGEQAGQHRDKLKASIHEQRSFFRKQVHAASRKYCEKLVENLHTSIIAPKLQRNEYHDNTDFTRDWNTIKKEYNIKAKGGAKLDVYNDFAWRKMQDGLDAISTRVKLTNTSILEELRSQLASAKREMSELVGREQLVKEELTSEQHAAREIVTSKVEVETELRDQIDQLEQQINALTKPKPKPSRMSSHRVKGSAEGGLMLNPEVLSKLTKEEQERLIGLSPSDQLRLLSEIQDKKCTSCIVM